MTGRVFSELEILAGAGLWFVESETPGAQKREVVHIGPGASPDELVSIACRHSVNADGRFDEDEVRAAVREYGYEYVAPKRPESTSRSDVWARVG
jgi:hypothetical protein